MRSWLLVVAVAACASGCAQDRSPVHGTYSYRYPDGVTVPVDLSAYQFQVYVPVESGFTVVPDAPVAGAADGTFDIPDVPDGSFLVRRTGGGTSVFIAYDDHDASETFDVLGRRDAIPSTSSTKLRLDANGLAQWHTGDRLVLDCFGNASEIANPTLTPALAEGAIEIHASLAWGAGTSWGPSGAAYLMDPTAGDALLVTRQTAHTTGDATAWTLTQTLDAAAPAQIAGEMTATGAFVDVEPTARLTAIVHGDSLAAALPAGTAADQVQVAVVVGPATERGTRQGPELAVLRSSAGEATAATLRYGDPFDPAWRPLVTTTYLATRTVHVHGGAGPVTYPAFTETRPLTDDTYIFEPLAPLGAVAIDDAPLDDVVAVPHQQSVRVDFAEPADATAGRLIVWSPESGAEIAYVTFDRAPVELPPDIFGEGGRYTLQIDVSADDGHGRVRTSGTYTDLFTIVAQ